MTIKPGEEWGRALRQPVQPELIADDATLATCVSVGGPGPWAVGGGDLHRATGAPRQPERGHVVGVDAMVVTLDDGREVVAVAHVVARRSWWHGPIVAICNVDFVGEWNVAPRAHPNDGRADVVEVAPQMGVRERWQAWRRLPQGTHVPHPQIVTRTVRQAAFEFARPLHVWIDGVRVGRASRLAVDVRPDAFELYL